MDTQQMIEQAFNAGWDARSEMTDPPNYGDNDEAWDHLRKLYVDSALASLTAPPDPPVALVALVREWQEAVNGNENVDIHDYDHPANVRFYRAEVALLAVPLPPAPQEPR